MYWYWCANVPYISIQIGNKQVRARGYIGYEYVSYVSFIHTYRVVDFGSEHFRSRDDHFIYQSLDQVCHFRRRFSCDDFSLFFTPTQSKLPRSSNSSSKHQQRQSVCL